MVYTIFPVWYSSWIIYYLIAGDIFGSYFVINLSAKLTYSSLIKSLITENSTDLLIYVWLFSFYKNRLEFDTQITSIF